MLDITLNRLMPSAAEEEARAGGTMIAIELFIVPVLCGFVLAM